MPSYTDFLTLTQWAGIATLACAAITVLGFILQWGIRFRLVGVTGFLGVLTGGLFALSLVPFTRTVIPGAVRFSLVYDTGATQTVIAVSPKITQNELEATLRQAASDLYSYGRLGRDENLLTIRARTIIHPEPGVSQPLYLGQVKRSLDNRNDEQMAIEIYQDKLARIADAA
ncbi:MAG: Ycf51 family protein [Chroococcidiopsidaceae cyanobacterium CP_BM_RX_35]|nr:Ycf51 family protein [Chroococcidiopsidaceae cyanobacterium CP_BM_RX_35]